MALRVLANQCKYCEALKKTKNTCERHEIACLSNPNAKNCMLCGHRTTRENKRVCGISGKLCSSSVSANCSDIVRERDG